MMPSLALKRHRCVTDINESITIIVLPFNIYHYSVIVTFSHVVFSAVNVISANFNLLGQFLQPVNLERSRRTFCDVNPCKDIKTGLLFCLRV